MAKEEEDGVDASLGIACPQGFQSLPGAADGGGLPASSSGEDPAAALGPAHLLPVDDSEQHLTLVDQIKSFQRSGARARREWNVFCDGNLG
eukprot:14432871-Alexandrium_andersonii.AAC.1